MSTNRAVLTVEWCPSASIGEQAAVRSLIDRTGDGLMERLLDWGVVDPAVSLEFGVVDDGGDETGLEEDEEE